MKRVVLEGEDTVQTKDCRIDKIYLGVHEDEDEKSFCLLTMNKLGVWEFKPFEFFNDSVEYTSLNSAIEELDNWNFYQFPDFRSAMQYYLEQTK